MRLKKILLIGGMVNDQNSRRPRVSHRQYAQGFEEWSDIGHQDILTSDLDKSNSRAGSREVDPRPVIS